MQYLGMAGASGGGSGGGSSDIDASFKKTEAQNQGFDLSKVLMDGGGGQGAAKGAWSQGDPGKEQTFDIKQFMSWM